MKGDAEVLRLLNDALTNELTAINQYLAHGKLHEHWGFPELAKKVLGEAADERGDADKLIARILFLEGVPNVERYHPIKIGDNAVAALESDLQIEYAHQRFLNEAIATCRNKGDHTSEELLRDILVGEEEHIDWLEIQLDLVRKLGKELYLARKL